jgi:hypothetical protein
LGQPGLWRISAVHMTRAPDGVDAEWDSLWASLTFEMSSGVRGAHCANRVAN